MTLLAATGGQQPSLLRYVYMEGKLEPVRSIARPSAGPTGGPTGTAAGQLGSSSSGPARLSVRQLVGKMVSVGQVVA